VPHRICLIFFLSTFAAILFFEGCGTSRPSAVPNPSLASSTIGCNNTPCSGSVDVPLILVDGADPGALGLPISCSVTAGAQTMNYIAAPSTPWFGVYPESGELAASGSTALSVNSINASNISGRNIGVVTVSAPGYNDNSQMAVELNCNVEGVATGTCKIAFSCQPSKYPLP
jgi:hypothetical protein